MPTVLSVVESPSHPNLSGLYRRLGLREIKTGSVRNALRELKRQQPDFVIAEFFYGYGNNYAGVNISNLDVLLSSLPKYAPQARVIVMVDKSERQYVDKLNDVFPLSAVLVQPVGEAQIEALLR
jgi:hypothetical protein